MYCGMTRLKSLFIEQDVCGAHSSTNKVKDINQPEAADERNLSQILSFPWCMPLQNVINYCPFPAAEGLFQLHWINITSTHLGFFLLNLEFVGSHNLLKFFEHFKCRSMSIYGWGNVVCWWGKICNKIKLMKILLEICIKIQKYR